MTAPKPKKTKKVDKPKSLYVEDRPAQLALKQTQFLDAYCESGRVDLATKHVGVKYQAPYQWAKTDPSFLERWNDAKKIAAMKLEDAAFKRAHTGYTKPIYQRGVLVGVERHYSDSLTMFLLRGAMPEKYRDRLDVEQSGKGGGPVHVAVGLNAEAAEFMKRQVLGITPDKEVK